MKINKWLYYRTIKESYGGKAENVDFHVCNSKGVLKDNKAFKVNIKAYKENSPCYCGTGFFKELNPDYLEIETEVLSQGRIEFRTWKNDQLIKMQYSGYDFAEMLSHFKNYVRKEAKK